jgi:ribose transport system permease protein
VSTDASAGHHAGLRHVIADYLGMAVVLAGLVFVFSLKSENFVTLTTFRTIANQIPAAIVIAVGMTFVLIIADIDLSVGSVLGLSGAVLGVLMVELHVPLWPALGACLLAGAICGAISGLVVVSWSVPSFIVTLGMMEMARGGAYLVTDSRTKYIGSDVEVISETTVLGLSLPFLIAIAAVVVGQLVLSQMAVGRHLIAVGTNPEAARLSGLDARPLRLAVFTACGLLCAVAAIIDTSRMAAADPNAGGGFELQAIAAVVVGGTSLTGGRGSVVRSLFGVLIIAVLSAGLAHIGAQESTKRLITGGVIVAAVIVDRYRQRRRGPGS